MNENEIDFFNRHQQKILYYVLFALSLALLIVAFVKGKVLIGSYALVYLLFSLFEFFSKSQIVRIVISSIKLILAIAFIIIIIKTR